MGNECVADGGTPHQQNIQIINNTRFPLELDISETCGRDCNHKGFRVVDGKINEGRTPPDTIKPFDGGSFSVSGRGSTAVAPEGSVFYRNEKFGLKLIVHWSRTGWTTKMHSSAGMSVLGAMPPQEKGLFASLLGADATPKPWSEYLTCEADVKNWTYTLSVRKDYEELMKAIKAVGKGKIDATVNW